MPLREVSNCRWCRWRANESGRCAKGHTTTVSCVSPQASRGGQRACPACFNEAGDCQYYQPSYATRALRKIGLRLPVLTADPTARRVPA